VGFAPRWKATTGLGWKGGPLSLNMLGRYVGRYQDYQEFVANTNTLGNLWLFDLNANLAVGKAGEGGGSWIPGLAVTLGAINIFDKAPQFAHTTPPYDFNTVDIRGRTLYVQITSRW
jgi:hypothetical protein